MIFTLQAQASVQKDSFPEKIETDLAPAIEQARQEMKQVITTYNHEHKFNLDDEMMEAQTGAQIDNQDLAAN